MPHTVSISHCRCPDYTYYTKADISGLRGDVTYILILDKGGDFIFFPLQEFLDQVIAACSNHISFNTSVFSPPVKIEDPPVYGKLGLSFTDYMGPGVITRYNKVAVKGQCNTSVVGRAYNIIYLTLKTFRVYNIIFITTLIIIVRSCSITFGISIGLTAVVLLVERNEGLLDRSWVAGVNVTELLISQVITQFLIIIVQIILMISIIIWAFKVKAYVTSLCLSTCIHGIPLRFVVFFFIIDS